MGMSVKSVAEHALIRRALSALVQSQDVTQDQEQIAERLMRRAELAIERKSARKRARALES